MGSPSQTSAGLLTPQDTWGLFNNISFVIRQWLNKVQTATPVKVVSCTNEGGLSPFGFVDVQPLVNQIDGQGNATPHATVFGLPYMRIQGGSNAIILDPKPGDIGVAVFASRDISKVKNTQGQSNPGSLRTFDYADGMYLGGILNGTPTQYIQFSDEGIAVVSPNGATITAPNVSITKTGDTPFPVMSQPFLTWFMEKAIPVFTAHGITFPTPPPDDSITSVLEAS